MFFGRMCVSAILQLFKFFLKSCHEHVSCVSSDCRSSDCNLNDSVLDRVFDSDLSQFMRAAMTRERIKQKPKQKCFTESSRDTYRMFSKFDSDLCMLSGNT